ncbi:MAG: small subunit ribosomal protein S4 [Flavobacteriaceae bacterium]|jgi:small subunit ribosomal protein S4
MSMNNIKKYKVGRRLGAGVYDKCQTQKFALSEARHEKNKRGGRRKNVSNYGKQLLEKQKVRFMYGVSEKQFSNYVKKAMATKEGNPQDALFQLLENRIDNVVYRLGLAGSRRHARQMVSHGHFIINGTKTTIPSYNVSNSDIIEVRKQSQEKPLFTNTEETKRTVAVNWLSFDNKNMKAEITGVPTEPDSFLDFTQVLEYYTR